MKTFGLHFIDKHKVQIILFVIAFILSAPILSGCSKGVPVNNEEIRVEEGRENISELLLQTMTDVAGDLKEVQSNDDGMNSIKNAQQWAHYSVYELANMISLQPQLLANIQNEFSYWDFTNSQKKWEEEFLPFLKRIKKDDIIAFINDVNKGFQFAAEGKIEQASDIFIRLGELLPKLPPNKAIMEEDISRKLLYEIKLVALEEAEKAFGADLSIPDYLPERFKHFGVFMQNNPGLSNENIIKQVWYDPENFELLLVTQWKTTDPNREEVFIFTTDLESLGKISDVYPWANYRCIYEFTKNGVSTQGFMLVNDKDKQLEYAKILESLQE